MTPTTRRHSPRSQQSPTAFLDAQLQIIPGGGHRPDIRTSDRVNPLLADFLLA